MVVESCRFTLVNCRPFYFVMSFIYWLASVLEVSMIVVCLVVLVRYFISCA